MLGPGGFLGPPGICNFEPASLLRLYKIARSEIDGLLGTMGLIAHSGKKYRVCQHLIGVRSRVVGFLLRLVA
jgi:hypothetical protein